MARYAAFLRGMNVGNRRASGGELRSCFEELGLTDVATFRASGNVVFSAKSKAAAKLARKIEKGLADGLGYDVLTFLRTAEEVRSIASHEPFDPTAVKASAGKLQVSILAEQPAPKARREVLDMAGESDLLAFEGRELYWLPSGGILETALELEAIEGLCGPSTRRTMGTMEGIAAKYFGE